MSVRQATEFKSYHTAHGLNWNLIIYLTFIPKLNIIEFKEVLVKFWEGAVQQIWTQEMTLNFINGKAIFVSLRDYKRISVTYGDR